MVCYCLDLRPNSKVGHFLSNKPISIITGFVQLAIWITSLVHFVFYPESVKQLASNTNNATYALSIVIVLVVVGFSVLLLYGLFKDRAGYINTYLIFNIVMTVFFIFSLLYALFTRPKEYGITKLLGACVMIMLNILFYFIIRNYYLSFLSKQSNGNPA